MLLERFSRAGPRGRGREWATLGIHPRIHPLSWLLSNNRLEKVPFVSVLHTSSNRLLLSNQDKGCTPSVVHSLPLPLGPALLNLWIMGWTYTQEDTLTAHNWQKWKRVFLTCSCHKIYRDEAVGLKSCKYTWKITIFVKMWNLGQNHENLICCQ